MLRTICVVAIILIGTVYAIYGPFYVLLLYLWYAYFRPDYWVWDPSFLVTLNVSLVIGIAVLVMSIPYGKNFRLTPLVGLIGLFFLQSLVSLMDSEHYAWSLAYWIEFAKVMTIAILITFLVTDRKQLRLVFLVIALSLGFESGKQGWVQMVLNPGGSNSNSNPMLGDNNGVAVGMMMLIPIFVALAQTATKRWERMLHRFFVVGVFYRGISTYSRGGFLTAGAVGLISFSRSKHKLRALVGIAVLAGIVWTVMPQRYWDRIQTLQASEDEQDSSARGRLFFWQIAVRMARANPLTGVGFYGFEPSYATYDTSDGAWGHGKAVHSAWFGVLSEMGYPGLVLLIAVIVTALMTCRRARRMTRGRPDLADLQTYATALQTSFIAYVVGMTFLNGQYLEMFWHFVGLSVALQRIAAAEVAPAADAVHAPATLPRFRVPEPLYVAPSQRP